jgi:hypothetical protein
MTKTVCTARENLSAGALERRGSAGGDALARPPSRRCHRGFTEPPRRLGTEGALDTLSVGIPLGVLVRDDESSVL